MSDLPVPSAPGGVAADAWPGDADGIDVTVAVDGDATFMRKGPHATLYDVAVLDGDGSALPAGPLFSTGMVGDMLEDAFDRSLTFRARAIRHEGAYCVVAMTMQDAPSTPGRQRRLG